MRLTLGDQASRLLLAAVLLTAAPAAAEDYPASVENGVLSEWLAKNTNIAPATVVSVTSDLVVAIAGKTMPAMAGGPIRLTLREEVIAPRYVDTVGGRSSLMSMEIHCEERRIRMEERRLYTGPNLTGGMQSSEPSAEWVRIPQSSILDEVAQAACSADYAWPLRSAGAPPPPELEVATLDAPPSMLPPGPDAKLVEDEPEEKVVGGETISVAVSAGSPVPEAVDPPAEHVGTPTPAPPEPTAEPGPPASEPGGAGSSPASQEVLAVPVETVAVELPAPELAVAIESATTPAPAPEAATTPVEPVALATSAPTVANIPDPARSGPIFAVQIGAYETQEGAEAAWEKLSMDRPLITAGLTFEIRPARVKGKDWLRGLVRSFDTRQDAVTFCGLIAGSEYGCILRPLAD